MPTVPGLPQLPPFRLVDRIVEHDLATGSLVAEKLLSVDDALWPGDLGQLSPSGFPQTLLIEALCQAAAAFNMLSAGAASEVASLREKTAVHGAFGGFLGRSASDRQRAGCGSSAGCLWAPAFFAGGGVICWNLSK